MKTLFFVILPFISLADMYPRALLLLIPLRATKYAY